MKGSTEDHGDLGQVKCEDLVKFTGELHPVEFCLPGTSERWVSSIIYLVLPLETGILKSGMDDLVENNSECLLGMSS